MKVVSRRTGLSPHVIRVWERRYKIVEPQRSETNRRVYSEAEVQRLESLAQLTEAGHAISHLADLTNKELQALLESEQARLPNPTTPALSKQESPDPTTLIAGAITAVRNFDNQALEAAFETGEVALGYSGMLEQILVPVLQTTGDLWESGEITAAHEHAASACIKDYLARSISPYGTSLTAPQLVITTPAGQLHELGAAVASAMALKMGWNTTYLGASLPAAEIAGAVIRRNARAVLLSIVYPADDPSLPDELRRIRKFVPQDLPILIGGRVASAYRAAIDEIGAQYVDTFGSLQTALQALRKTSV